MFGFFPRCAFGDARVGNQLERQHHQGGRGRLLRVQHQIQPLGVQSELEAQREYRLFLLPSFVPGCAYVKTSKHLRPLALFMSATAVLCIPLTCL